MNSLPTIPETAASCYPSPLSVRIALTITELEPGGAEQCLVNLAVYLHDAGHEVRVYVLGRTPDRLLGNATDRNRLYLQLDADSIQWRCGEATSFLSLLTVARWLRSELYEFQPDVIQSMLFHANVVTAIANGGLRKPHFGGERVRQPQWWRRRLSSWAATRMEKLVCVSQRVADDCRLNQGIPADRLVVIPNGIQIRNSEIPGADARELHLNSRPPSNELLVDLWPGQPPSWLSSFDGRIFLFVGRLAEQKGIESLIQNAARLLGPFPSYQLVILGDGPLKTRVQKMVSESDVGAQIHILGWQANAIDWMRASDVILLPSLYEGMPNVVLEAMSVARPVVGFDVEGVRELLASEPGQTDPYLSDPQETQIVASEDWKAFIQSAQAIAGDPELAARLGGSNFRRARQKFQLQEQLSRYERIYAESDQVL